MTFDEALSCLRDLRALERLQRAVQERPAPSVEWRCGLVALDDRIRLLRYCLGQENQALLDAVQDRYDDERRLERLQPQSELSSEYPATQAPMPDLPHGSRIH